MINITQAGRYFLADDLTQCNSGISITVSDVKLELRGHTIQGVFATTASTEVMIFANGGTAGLSNIDIEGPGTVTGGSTGIDFENVHGSRVHNLVAVGNSNEGILVNASMDNEFSNNVVTANTTNGFTVNAGTNNEFRDNVVTGNLNDGIQLSGGNQNRFIHNNLDGNGTDGLLLSNNAINNVVRRNTVVSNLGNGIEVGSVNTTDNSSGNTIDHNTALNNSQDDLTDQNPSCQTSPPNTPNSPNTWTQNSFNTSFPIISTSSCIQ
jgi:parallel beta-helix repeat protein